MVERYWTALSWCAKYCAVQDGYKLQTGEIRSYELRFQIDVLEQYFNIIILFL